MTDAFPIGWWKRLSIPNKLYVSLGIIVAVVAAQLFTLYFAMQSTSASRAMVGSEHFWSLARERAIESIQRYRISKNESDYQKYLFNLDILNGFNYAKKEFFRENPNTFEVRKGLIAAQLDPDDIQPIINLVKRFRWSYYVDRALDIGRHGDFLLEKLVNEGTALKLAVESKEKNEIELNKFAKSIADIDVQMIELESTFSQMLGRVSRWLEGFVFKIVVVVSVGLSFFSFVLIFLTGRSLSRGLNSLIAAANKIGKGEYETSVPIHSSDEVGRLGQSVNAMGKILRKTYDDLELRVLERTRELSDMAVKNEQLYSEAKAAIQTRDEFLSVASHELRTPLTALCLRLQLLSMTAQKGPTEPNLKALEMLSEKSIQDANRLCRLLDEVLDLTRIRLGRLEVNKSKCDLISLVKEATSSMATEAVKNGCEISMDGLKPITGLFDPVRMGQVFTNLISNAIKYGPGKPIVIKADVKDGKAVVSVHDNGIGISQEQHGRIFHRFERVEPDANVSGLGLGLYISNQIVEAHGGTISVQSTLGQGSVFSVALNLS